MGKIDYSKISKPRSNENAFSVDNSFYLLRSKEIPGRYKAYYEYDTAGMKMNVVGGKERPD